MVHEIELFRNETGFFDGLCLETELFAQKLSTGILKGNRKIGMLSISFVLETWREGERFTWVSASYVCIVRQDPDVT